MNAVPALLRTSLLLILPFLLSTSARAADAVADFYRGKTVTIIVGAPTGGIYDVYARTLARHLKRHIPGNSNVIVQNAPSSGSLSSVNDIYNALPQDGTVIGAPSNAAPFLPLLGIDQVLFDPKKILWLGSPTGESSVFFVWHRSPVKSFDDLKAHRVIIGSNGPNATPAFIAKAMNSVFGTDLKSIYGYPGPADVLLAMERGEVDGYAGIFWNQLKNAYGDLIKDGKIRFILQFGASANRDLTDVPLAADLIRSPADKELFAAVIAPLATGYPLLMGPGVPKERGDAMIKAVAATFADKDFLDEAKRLNLAVDPLSSTDLQKIIFDSYALSADLVGRLRALYNAP